MHMPPTLVPLHALGRNFIFCSLLPLVEVVDEQHRVSEERKTKGRVGRRELFVGNTGSNSVHARATTLSVSGDSQYSEITELVE
jgi:hypothetical protein